MVNPPLQLLIRWTLQNGKLAKSELKTGNGKRVCIYVLPLRSVSDWTPPTSVTLKDLGGIDDCIQEVLELIVMPLKHPEIYSHTGVQPPRLCPEYF